MKFSYQIDKNYLKEIPKSFYIIWKDGKNLLYIYLISILINPLLSISSTILPAKFLSNLSSIHTEQISLENFISITYPIILFFFLDSVVFSLFYMIVQRIEKKTMLKLKLISHERSTEILSKLDNKHFDFPQTYDIIKKGRIYDYTIAKNIVKRPFDWIADIITYIGYLIILMPLGYGTIIILTLSILISYYFAVKIEKFKDEIERKNTSEKRRYLYLTELLLDKFNLQELKVYGLFTYLESKLNKTHSIIVENSERVSKYAYVNSFISYFISAVPAWSCLIYIVIQTHIGSLSPEQFFLLSSAIEKYVAHVQGLVDDFKQINRESLKIEHFSNFASIKNEIMTEEKRITHTKVRNIELKNVYFSYAPNSSSVLKNISFSIPAGSLVSIVGPNGAGKSSLVKLIAQLYKPTNGVILINSTPMSVFDPSMWYKDISVLFQNYHLFALTLHENICFDSTDAGKMFSAIQNAKCSNIIKNLENSYETNCSTEFNENGTDFSQGEKQRLCLARAFYKSSDLWILDEPSASIDPISEDAIFKYIHSQKGAKTIFLVSHRLSIAKQSDIILVLKDGELVEQGSHDELMANSKFYAELFKSQAERYL